MASVLNNVLNLIKQMNEITEIFSSYKSILNVKRVDRWWLVFVVFFLIN